MTFTGVSPQASVFGNEQNQGIIVPKCVDVDAPGGIIFVTNVAGTIQYVFVWMSAVPALRFVDCSPATGTVAVYDPGSNILTFTAFDQATSGAAV